MTIYFQLQFLLISPDYLSMLAHSSFMLYLLVFTTSISYPSGNQSRHFQLYQTYLQSFLPPSKYSFARYNFSSKPYWLLSLIIRTPSISVVFFIWSCRLLAHYRSRGLKFPWNCSLKIGITFFVVLWYWWNERLHTILGNLVISSLSSFKAPGWIPSGLGNLLSSFCEFVS